MFAFCAMFVHALSKNLGSDKADVLLKLCTQQKCAVLDKSAPCVQQNDILEKINYAEELRSINVIGVNCSNKHVR